MENILVFLGTIFFELLRTALYVFLYVLMYSYIPKMYSFLRYVLILPFSGLAFNFIDSGFFVLLFFQESWGIDSRWFFTYIFLFTSFYIPIVSAVIMAPRLKTLIAIIFSIPLILLTLFFFYCTWNGIDTEFGAPYMTTLDLNWNNIILDSKIEFFIANAVSLAGIFFGIRQTIKGKLYFLDDPSQEIS